MAEKSVGGKPVSELLRVCFLFKKIGAKIAVFPGMKEKLKSPHKMPMKDYS
jgi:hypothetical protein